MKSSQSSINRRGLERLDFLLLLIESLEINGVYSLIVTSQKLDLDNKLNNSVDLWKTRTHNPLRKTYRRGSVSNSDIKILISLISITAERLYPLLRQLLSNKEPLEISEKRWNILNNRFNDLFYERMNLRLGIVKRLLVKENSRKFLRELVLILAFSAGQGGFNRLKNNIIDLG